VGVCDDTADCALISKLSTSGIKLFKGATGGRRVLVYGAPASCGPASALTNLKLWGQCVDISADPKDGESFPLSSPTDRSLAAPAVVQTCIAEEIHHDPLAEYLYTAPVGGSKPGRLGKLSDGTSRVSVQPPVAPFFAANCDKAQTFAAAASVPTGSFGAVTRVASGALASVAEFFGPRVAEAAHGGLGTLPGGTNSLSLFGPIDPFVFQATFTGDAVGQRPIEDDRGRSKWAVVTLNPGEVLVQASLGDIASKLVVMNQQGGAASSKPGIQLIAPVAQQKDQPAYASAGVYRIRWRSLVATPKAFEANFVVLDSEQRILAQFTYANSSAAQGGPILFNGAPTGLTWVQNASQTFEITIDLDPKPDAKRVSFGVQGQAPVIEGVPYLNPNAVNLASAGWQIKSQNAQTIGMDDLEIVRVPDSAAAP
jgi:hypothetical protein